jgi:hypothetical protein
MNLSLAFGETRIAYQMQGQAKITERSAWLQDCNSMLISALCNLVVLVALGLLTGAVKDPWGGIKLMADAGAGDEASFDDSPLDDTIELEASEDTAAAVGAITALDATVPAAEMVALDALAENAGRASGVSGLEGVGFGGKGAGDGAAGSAEFFGIGGYGQTFVYVVDASDSMNVMGKFDRARYELLQSIEQLSSDQRYFVIFYNDGAYPMDADEPVLRTEDNFAATTDWVNHARANGGTNPLPALVHALSLRPDAIYFLSDGQFDPMAIQVLRMKNRPTKRVKQRQIPIHTIAFVDYMTIGIMRTIARDSGGEHRFVK